jgi:hypothetical protein
MDRVILPADQKSDLEWKDLQPQEVFWEFDFGWGGAPLFLSDQAAFQGSVLAIEEFSKRLSKGALGAILYCGTLGIIQRIVEAENEVEAANMFGDYLHRLASFLPDAVTPYCLFTASPFSKARTAQLTSKERFLHLELSLEPNMAKAGILLPSDEQCTEAVLQKIDELMECAPNGRIIPELRLNEMWQELDLLYVIPETLSLQGKRHLQGFKAAGGEVQSLM